MEHGPELEVVIIKQANPLVGLSKKNHGRTYFPILRGAESSVPGGEDTLCAVGWGCSAPYGVSCCQLQNLCVWAWEE